MPAQVNGFLALWIITPKLQNCVNLYNSDAHIGVSNAALFNCAQEAAINNGGYPNTPACKPGGNAPAVIPPNECNGMPGCTLN